MTLPALSTALTVVMLAGLLVGERRRDGRLRVITKPLASLGFVLVPIVGGAGGGVAPWIIAGLILGMLGDVLLLRRERRWFLAGLVAFLLGHLAYVVAFAELVPPARWSDASMLPVLIPVAVLAAVVLRWLWPHLGSMKAPVVAYVAVIVTMLVGGIACRQASPLATAGAALFFASDLAVARERFVAEGFVNRAWGLPAYYAGQLLIAWSLLVA